MVAKAKTKRPRPVEPVAKEPPSTKPRSSRAALALGLAAALALALAALARRPARRELDPPPRAWADGCPAATTWTATTLENFFVQERPVQLHELRHVLSAAEAASLVRLADHEAAVFDTQPDTIDSLPAFEIYLLREGETTDAASPGNAGAEVWEAVRRRFEACVTPFVRAHFNCSACVPCTSLVRRYRAGERVAVPPHRDVEAHVTVVVELRQADAGGLYVLETLRDAPKFARLGPGDAAVHNYELLHGVNVTCASAGCARYSLIAWFQKEPTACAAGHRWPSAARAAMIDKVLPIFVRSAREKLGAALGARVDDATARRAMEAHADKGGILNESAWPAAMVTLGKSLKESAARDAAIDAGLDKFANAATMSLRRDVSRAAARRAMAAHADESGGLNQQTFYAALAALRSEL